MRLQGSCHCGAVKFECESKHPVPYQKDCRGWRLRHNLAAEASTLTVSGEENVIVYQAAIQNPEDSSAQVSSARRRFCKKCGSALWLDDPRWPHLIHPFASAIDTDLPLPPTKTHLMIDFKPPGFNSMKALLQRIRNLGDIGGIHCRMAQSPWPTILKSWHVAEISEG